MPSLESDKVDRALKRKMKADVSNDPGDRYYTIFDDDGILVASTSMSKGSKHSISASMVSVMAREMSLKTDEFAGMVNCRLSREAALAAIAVNTDDER